MFEVEFGKLFFFRRGLSSSNAVPILALNSLIPKKWSEHVICISGFTKWEYFYICLAVSAVTLISSPCPFILSIFVSTICTGFRKCYKSSIISISFCFSPICPLIQSKIRLRRTECPKYLYIVYFHFFFRFKGANTYPYPGLSINIPCFFLFTEC